MIAKEILIAARAKITNKENWTKGNYARTKSGDVCPSRASYAYSFCALGALNSLWCQGEHYLAEVTLIKAAKKLYPNFRGIVEVNDKLGHDDVLKCYDLAIKMLEL